MGIAESQLREVLKSWGPGKFDAEVNHDGRGLRPDGRSGATLIPAAFGLAGQNLHTYEGWGSIPYWNAYVANTQMFGQGTFVDPRLDDWKQFPIAARTGAGDLRKIPDRISAKLAALHFYQLSIPAPVPPAGSFDPAAAARGQAVFEGKATCASCHVPPLFSEPGWPMHTAAEIGIDDFQAARSPDRRYRTTPLHGLFARAKGGFMMAAAPMVKLRDPHSGGAGRLDGRSKPVRPSATVWPPRGLRNRSVSALPLGLL